MLKPKSTFEKIDRKNLPDQIIRQIRAMIEKGLLKPNDRLPSERELAEMLGVSRLPLREALKSLQSTNVLDVRPGEGYFVRGIETVRLLEFFEGKLNHEKDMLNDLKEARIIIELGAIDLACERRTEADIKRMRNSNEKMKKAVNEDSEDVIKYSMEFHNHIFEASRNGFLISIMACMNNALYEGRFKSLKTINKRYLLAYEEHNEMLEAIAVRDAERAKSLMRHHLQSSYHVD